MAEVSEEGKEEEKKNKNKGDGEKKKGGGGGGDGGKKKADEAIVLKVDMHCEGCARKVKKIIKGFEGVETVEASVEHNKVTVKGKSVDPWSLRDRVEEKTRKKVEIVSPKDTPPKKKPDAAAAKKPVDEKKAPAAAVSPAVVVLKIPLHCEGCIERIRKTVLKVKGVQSVTIDEAKGMVTVHGTMDAKSLPETLTEKLKRSAEIVPAAAKGGGGEKKKKGGGGGGGDKNEKGDDSGDGKETGGDVGDDNEKGGAAGEEKEKGGGGGGGGKKKGKGGGGGGDGGTGKEAPAVVAVEVNRMDYFGPYGYGLETVHAPQLFSDENPNACTVM